MATLAISLIILSSFMHAAWNLLARRKRSESTFFTRMLVVTIITGFLPTVVAELMLPSLPAKACICLLGSGFCCGLYFFSLGRAYGLSDFTIVYPVVRALPVVLVGFGDTLLGRELTGAGWIGLVLVTTGCLLTPLESIQRFNIRHYVNASMVWIILAAIGIVGYSLFDKAASEVVPPGPISAARYGYIFFFFATVVCLVLKWIVGCDVRKPIQIGWKLPIVAAICNFGSYWLVLWAYQLSSHAGYVVAFRQTSIIIGVAVAFVIYKERGMLIRITGSLMITAGLILVAMFGN